MKIVDDSRGTGDVVQVKVPDNRISGLNGRFYVDGALNDDLPLDSNLEVRRDVHFGQCPLERQGSGKKRGCVLHGERGEKVG